MNSMYHDLEDFEELSGQASVNYKQTGLQQKAFTQLKRGKKPFIDTLDLHDYSLKEAQNQLEDFILDNQASVQQVLLVIHGKGQHGNHRYAKLKSVVCHQLQQMPEVLAYCSALPKDGGSGALYVLLKRYQQE